jgi:hypothetical protein
MDQNLTELGRTQRFPNGLAQLDETERESFQFLN